MHIGYPRVSTQDQGNRSSKPGWSGRNGSVVGGRIAPQHRLDGGLHYVIAKMRSKRLLEVIHQRRASAGSGRSASKPVNERDVRLRLRPRLRLLSDVDDICLWGLVS